MAALWNSAGIFSSCSLFFFPSFLPSFLPSSLPLLPSFPLYIPPFFSFFFLFFLAYSQRSEIGCLPFFHTRCGLSTNLECRSEICGTRLAQNTGRKKSPKIRHLGTITQLCRTVSSQLRHMYRVDNRKKVLSSNISSTCSHNAKLRPTNG